MPQAEAAEKELKPLMDFIKSTLGERVERVEVSRRLSDSPVALVTSKFGWTANMERIMKSQVRSSRAAPDAGFSDLFPNRFHKVSTEHTADQADSRAIGHTQALAMCPTSRHGTGIAAGIQSPNATVLLPAAWKSLPSTALDPEL
jgi:HSP90 family molecular chaperone